jgi:hypothetical protein
MNDWITDRLPDPDDAFEDWVFVSEHGNIQMYLAVSVKLGMPWLPIVPPDPYVKPKRWAVKYNSEHEAWAVVNNGMTIDLFLFEDDADAAQRICDIYNEVMP